MSDNDEYYQIVNWQKYQQPLRPRKDGAHVERTWIKVWAKIMHHRIWDCSPSHLKVFITLVILGDTGGRALVDPEYVARRARVNPKHIPSILTDLEQFQILTREKTVYRRKRRGERKKENTKPISPSFDFTPIKEKYPNNVGSLAGVKKLSSGVKTKKDFADCCAALDNYLDYVAHQRKNGFKDLRHKNFSTWCNQWRDWVEPKVEKKKTILL